MWITCLTYVWHRVVYEYTSISNILMDWNKSMEVELSTGEREMPSESDLEKISNFHEQQMEHMMDLMREQNKEVEEKCLVQEMMGEQYDKYFWDEKHAL